MSALSIILAFIYFAITVWLILKGPKLFGRSEIQKTYGPRKDYQVKYSSVDAIKVYEEYYMSNDMGYQLFNLEDGRGVFQVFHKILNKAPLLDYVMPDDFFRRKSLLNIAHTLKVLGFSHLVFHPGQEVRELPAHIFYKRHTWLRKRLTKSTILTFTRWMFIHLSLFTVVASVIAADFIFFLEFLPFVFFLTIVAYIIYLIREMWLYFKQNRVSLKIAEDMNLDMNDVDYVKCYLRKSLIRYIILQIFIVLFIFIAMLWILVAFSAS